MDTSAVTVLRSTFPQGFVFLFPLCRFRAVSLFGNLDHAQTKYVLHGSPAGEGGVRDVLPRRSALPQLLLALPHRLLSLRESLADFF